MKRVFCLMLMAMFCVGCTILKNKATLPNNVTIDTTYIYPVWTAKSHSMEFDPQTGKFKGTFESSATSMVDSINAMSGLVEKAVEGGVKGAAAAQ